MFNLTTTHLTAWLIALSLAAAITDARGGLIPNWLTLPSLLLAPLVQFSVAGPGACAHSLLGAVCCGLVPLLLFGLRAMGGGDVKLFAAIGAVAGAGLGLEIQITSYAMIALYALCTLAHRGQMLATLGRSLALLLAPFRPKAKRALPPPEAMLSLRLGPAIFAATVSVLLAGTFQV
mgnify:CR=1 FL=1